MKQQLRASKQLLLETATAHTFIPNTSPKHETATSTLKHEQLYYLSISSITPALPSIFLRTELQKQSISKQQSKIP